MNKHLTSFFQLMGVCLLAGSLVFSGCQSKGRTVVVEPAPVGMHAIIRILDEESHIVESISIVGWYIDPESGDLVVTTEDGKILHLPHGYEIVYDGR